MKKWYVITVILALLLVVSISTCSSNSDKVDILKNELTTVKAELSELQSSYDELLYEYDKLQGKIPAAPEETTKIETFDFNDLIVSLVEYHWDRNDLITTWSFYNNRPQKVDDIELKIKAYDQDGNFIYNISGENLWPGETKNKTVAWPCGPRSFAITFYLKDWQGGWTDEKFIEAWIEKEITITR